MNAEASQDGSQRGQLLFRRTSAACNMLSDKLSHVRINSEGSSTQLCTNGGGSGGAAAMSQDGGAGGSAGQQAAAAGAQQQTQGPSQQPPGMGRQSSQQLLMRGLTIDTTRYPSQSDMAW
jgi:hypothetical protein